MDCRHISIGLGLCSSQNCLFYSCFGSSGVSTFTFASLVVQMVVKPTLIAVWSMPAPVGAIALRAHPHLTSLFDRRRYRDCVRCDMPRAPSVRACLGRSLPEPATLKALPLSFENALEHLVLQARNCADRLEAVVILLLIP